MKNSFLVQLTPPLNRTPQNYATQICRIIDDFVDVVDADADRRGGVLHGFQNQVISWPSVTKHQNHS